MKYSVALTLLAAAVVSAQSSSDSSSASNGLASLANLPKCAQECTTGALGDIGDCDIATEKGVTCLCQNKKFQDNVKTCVKEKCNDADQCTTANLSKGTCGKDVELNAADLPKGCTITSSSSSSTSGTGNDTSSTDSSTVSGSGNGTTTNDTASGTESSASGSASASGSSGAGQLVVSGTAALFGLVAFLAL